MNVLVYAGNTAENIDRLTSSCHNLRALRSMIDCRTIAELLSHLRSPEPLPDAVVFFATSRQELRRLESFRFRLEQVFFILVLPDAEVETVARGHQLRPRFIAYQDSDLSEVTAVLTRFSTNQSWRQANCLIA